LAGTTIEEKNLDEFFGGNEDAFPEKKRYPFMS
jgi:hypothetical protein